MRVTIITVASNSEKTISRAIDSVLNQTYGDIEYIIVDGASRDRTVEIAEKYQKLFDKTPGRSLRILSEPDEGMYDALNKGAKLATGELVGQINSDDWYEKDAVQTMVNLYETEHYDVAWGSIRIKKASGDMIKHAHIGRLWTTTGWCHPGMFSRREILLKYPYALETMYDDFDYITTVYRAGKKITTTDRIIANFVFGGMSTQKSWKEAMRRVKITYGIYRKHGMSRLYWFHRFALETAKFVLG